MMPAMSRGRLRTKAIVALKVEPERRGRVVQVLQNGRMALVQFDGYPRATLHDVEGLILVAPNSQLPLW